MHLVVGRIAKSHGLRGEVAVDVRTDAPDDRFAPGSVIATEPLDRGPLTVLAARWHSGRLLVTFDAVDDRDAADALRGTLLVADSTTSPPPPDTDEFWDHDLVGLKAELTDGTGLGQVTDVLHTPGSVTLVIARQPVELLVPFIAAFVPTVDLAGGRVVIDPPDGLLDL